MGAPEKKQKQKADGSASGMFLPLRPREVRVPCPVRKRGLADAMWWVTAMSRWVDRSSQAFCGMPMSCRRTGSPCLMMGHAARVRAILRREGGGIQASRPDPGPPDIGIPSGPDEHRRLVSGRGGSNKPFSALA